MKDNKTQISQKKVVNITNLILYKKKNYKFTYLKLAVHMLSKQYTKTILASIKKHLLLKMSFF